MRRLLTILAAILLASAAEAAPTAVLVDYLKAADKGDSVATEKAAKTALAASPQAAGLDPADYVGLAIEIGRGREFGGDFAGAEKAYARALDVAEGAFGPDSLELRAPLIAIGDLKAARGDVAGAEAAYLQSLRIAIAELGPENGSLREELDRLGRLPIPVRPGPNGEDRAGDYLNRSRNIAEAERFLGEVIAQGGETAGESSCDDAGAENAAERIAVFYGGNRKISGRTTPRAFYLNDYDRGAPVKYGVVMVSLPCSRELGSIPTEQLWKLEFRPDRAKHVVLESVTPISSETQFWQAAKLKIAGTERKEALVFFHGFNTDFAGAAMRTAQLAADTGLDGAPFFYDWASKAALLGYNADREIATSAPVIAEAAAFVQGVAEKTGAERVIVIAHSMGNEPLLRGLERLANGPWANAPKPKIAEAVFAAPDVNVDNFKSFIQAARKVAGNLTLYASTKDKALAYSGWRSDFRRAGDAREKVSAEGLVSVDTTAASGDFIGHDDFAGNGLDDLRAVLWFGARPDGRCVLRPLDSLKRLWSFRPKCENADFKLAVTLLRRRGLEKALADLKATKEAAATTPGLSSAERNRRRARTDKVKALVESLHGAITPAALKTKYAAAKGRRFAGAQPIILAATGAEEFSSRDVIAAIDRLLSQEPALGRLPAAMGAGGDGSHVSYQDELAPAAPRAPPPLNARDPVSADEGRGAIDPPHAGPQPLIPALGPTKAKRLSVHGYQLASITPLEKQKLLEACAPDLKLASRISGSIGEVRDRFIDAAVFEHSDFVGVRMGWCDMSLWGAWGRTVCDNPIQVFFDYELQNGNMRGDLFATFAHEMDHALEYKEWRRDGKPCTDLLLPEYSAVVEELAERASYEAMRVLYEGRKVYFRNGCGKPVSLFVVIQPLPGAAWRSAGWWNLPAQSYYTLTMSDAPIRTTNRNIWFYAETPDGDIWSDSATTWNLQERDYGVMKASTSVAGPRGTVEGAFEFAVTCS